MKEMKINVYLVRGITTQQGTIQWPFKQSNCSVHFYWNKPREQENYKRICYE